jgi:copper chaperone NosL
MRKGISIILAVLMALAFCVSESRADEDVIGKKGEVCGKRIEDKRFAAYIQKEGETLYFDDVGHAFFWRTGECIATLMACDAATWAFDYYSKERVHMRAAYYVINKDLKTPSGTGVVAFKEEDGAKRFLEEHGGEGPLDFDQVQERF